MTLKSLATALFITSAILFVSCNDGGKSADNDKPLDVEELTKDQPETHGSEVKPGDVELTNPLNQEWVTHGKEIYGMKCQSCHKLTDQRLVGPGWAGITKKRDPVWVMNMITNVEVMLETDPEAQKLLEQCMVRMPNQNISKDEARHLLEYMRANDGEK